MQIRNRKNTIALIRTTYDPLTKRGRSEQLGTLSRDATSAPEELVARLTELERRQLTSWLSYQQCMHTAQTQCAAAVTLPQQLRDVAAWYRRQPKGSTNLATLAASSRDEWSEVLAAMSTAGVGRTRKRTPSTPSTPSTQKKTRQISGS
jgi:hypothetical protein